MPRAPRQQRKRTSREDFIFWWPFALQVFGFALGLVHIIAVGSEPDVAILGFAGTAIATGKAFEAQNRRNAASEPATEEEGGEDAGQA